MLGKVKLKELFFEIKKQFPQLSKKTEDQILIIIYNYLTDNYGDLYNKNDARELQLCIMYNYGCLYK